MAASQRIIPLLVYEDIEAAHEFLVSAFGLRAGRLDRDDEGQIVHGEVHADDDVIWLHRVAPDHELASPRSLEAASGGVVVVVDDVDAHHEQARAAGARIDHEPTDQPYGFREYSARDPEGGRWFFEMPLS
jgi:uncharacterized glyoxalase superfamily protein PhnB